MNPGTMNAVLELRDLAVTFRSQDVAVPAVEGVSFTLREAETLAIVGESSSGKSVTALALMRLLPPPPSCRVGGSARLFAGDAALDLLTMPDAAMQDVRGRQIAMIFQEPMTSLNPVHTVGAQIVETLVFHEHLSTGAATARAVELLDHVGITEPRRRLGSYPHHLSGGMRQRVMIAMALACRPRVLIADEPTTALDVTIQAQILDLLRRLQQETGMAVIFITHNLGVVAELADRVLVMYAGQVVEEAPVAALLRRPLMPYTAGLLRSVPRLDAVLRKGVRLRAISGNVPDPADKPAGCTFHPRCEHAVASVCDLARPALETVGQHSGQQYRGEQAAEGEHADGEHAGGEHAGREHKVRCARWREIAA
jgi:oligopeptide transport system ATP-binding protein